jgi:peptidylglycine monooxygenase
MNTQGLFVALGPRRYRVERPFGDLPAGLVSDVSVDPRGHVFVLLRRDSLCSPPAPAVIELAADGSRLAEWGEEISDAHMLTVGPNGLVYVVDRDAHEVIIFDKQGHRIGGLGHRHQPGNPLNHPTDVALLPDGRIAVSDGYGNACVHIFAAYGQHVRSFGEIGIAPGAFITPHSIWPIGVNRIVVADRENHRLQLFQVDGTLLDVWTGFFRPQAIWGDGAQIYVTDSVPSLALLTETGERIGRCRPVLNGAHGLSGDVQSGVLYLAEGNPSRLTRLVPLPD